MPKDAIKAMLAFDRGEALEPFSFRAEFFKTTKVAPTSPERRAQINVNRAKRKAEGRPDKKYGLSKRLQGIAFTAELAKELNINPA